MGRKGVKIPNETKLKYAKLCFENKMSKKDVSRQLGVDRSDVSGWVYRYREHGELAFLDTGRNNVYSPELRLQAVHSYLNGEGSQREIAAKYGLKNVTQLKRWIKMYNNGEDFSHKMSGGSREELVAMIENYIYYYSNLLFTSTNVVTRNTLFCVSSGNTLLTCLPDEGIN